MRLQLIESYNEFVTLREQWNTLLSKSDSNIIFLRHEWLSAWWEGFGGDRKLSILLIKKAHDIIGAAPFMISKRTLSKFPVKSLHFLGMGLGSSDFILKEDKNSCLKMIFGWINDISQSWDIVHLAGIPCESENFFLLPKIVQSNRFLSHDGVQTIYYLSVGNSLDDVWRARPRKLRYNIRRRLKRAKELGELKYDRLRKIQCPEEVCSRIFDVSLRSWKVETGGAIGGRQNLKIFFSRLTELLASTGVLDILIMNLAGRDIAYRYGFVYNDKYVEFDIAYDAQYAAISPGSLALAHQIELLSKANVKILELGQAFEWKQHWTPLARKESDMIVFNKSLYAGWLYHAKTHIQPYIYRFMS